MQYLLQRISALRNCFHFVQLSILAWAVVSTFTEEWSSAKIWVLSEFELFVYNSSDLTFGRNNSKGLSGAAGPSGSSQVPASSWHLSNRTHTKRTQTKHTDSWPWPKRVTTWKQREPASFWHLPNRTNTKRTQTKHTDSWPWPKRVNTWKEREPAFSWHLPNRTHTKKENKHCLDIFYRKRKHELPEYSEQRSLITTWYMSTIRCEHLLSLGGVRYASVRTLYFIEEERKCLFSNFLLSRKELRSQDGFVFSTQFIPFQLGMVNSHWFTSVPNSGFEAKFWF